MTFRIEGSRRKKRTTFDVLNYRVNDGSMRRLSAGYSCQVDQDEIVEAYLVHSSTENH